LTQKYKAKKIELKEINTCLRKRFKIYFKGCDTPLLVSEEQVLNEDYIYTYKIEAINISHDPFETERVWKDTAVIIGSKDGRTLTSFFVGFPNKSLTYELKILSNQSLSKILQRLDYIFS
ncbi:MAG: hypothetical protein IJY38_04525, partial [Clostridia bacterium]|nr:hypothetical protein [Clostridia bacterium]